MAFLKILASKGQKIRAYTAFEGAGNGRRLSNWGTSTAGPNSTLYSSLNILRARSRELSRNDPQIDGALDCLVSNIVGMGISPRWQLPNSKLKKALQQLWAHWMFREHPGKYFMTIANQFDPVRIPASEILHTFKPLRPGQQRGRPWFASLILTMHELNYKI